MPPDASAPLVALQDVTYRVGGNVLVEHVSLAVAPRQIVSLIGPNGAGKTTTVRLALGLLQPSEGRVARRPGLSVGYVPQRLTVDRSLPLTVRRLLSLTARPTPAEAQAALDETGAGHLAGREVHDLSGGEWQRVLIARALLRQPALLVLDEPVQGVDVTGQAELFTLIRTLRDRRGCGVLLVSHDLHLVMAATDAVICLNRHVCCSGRPDRVVRDPAYRDLFGDAATALAVYAHHHDHVHDATGAVVPVEGHHHHDHHDHAHHNHG
ncbi:zinc transport system ATP-binding protein [Stella humosa]|uniref:Zinc transport system ATP-binding protein n=1 Tax=Stella humosa TaxID=94 RepID=A0A3N1KZ97_9PROT|nr:metal ABC transporter ATP-binding protein [Stella humosa]ROP83638.1 zinc transport system ATP-binding protein [Stella humosa]BBK33089.1 zinc import ATP-binding protein ZnuC [Stella humosa]